MLAWKPSQLLMLILLQARHHAGVEAVDLAPEERRQLLHLPVACSSETVRDFPRVSFITQEERRQLLHLPTEYRNAEFNNRAP